MKPKATLSAAVFGNREMVREKLFQEGDRWLEENLVDVAFPMIYTTIGVYKHENDDISIEQIQRAWLRGNGFCLFAYSSFFPKPPEPQKQLDQDQVERENKRCGLRLNNLRPLLVQFID